MSDKKKPTHEGTVYVCEPCPVCGTELSLCEQDEGKKKTCECGTVIVMRINTSAPAHFPDRPEKWLDHGWGYTVVEGGNK